MDAAAAASANAEAMFSRDRASAHLGISVVELAPGFAVTQMPTSTEMLNGHEVVHGAFVFAVADTAFALACNNDEHVTLAAGADIVFLRPARAGSVLTATAQRRSVAGRSGIYDVQVVAPDGQVIAEFRGRSRTFAETR